MDEKRNYGEVNIRRRMIDKDGAKRNRKEKDVSVGGEWFEEREWNGSVRWCDITRRIAIADVNCRLCSCCFWRIRYVQSLRLVSNCLHNSLSNCDAIQAWKRVNWIKRTDRRIISTEIILIPFVGLIEG